MSEDDIDAAILSIAQDEAQKKADDATRRYLLGEITLAEHQVIMAECFGPPSGPLYLRNVLQSGARVRNELVRKERRETIVFAIVMLGLLLFAAYLMVY